MSLGERPSSVITALARALDCSALGGLPPPPDCTAALWNSPAADGIPIVGRIASKDGIGAGGIVEVFLVTNRGIENVGAASVDDGAFRVVARWRAKEEGVADAFDFPGFVPAYIRPLFCRGVGPFRWVALSGDPEDIAKTDAKIQLEEAIAPFMAKSTDLH